MLERDEWFDLAHKLDWEPTYVDEAELYPEAISGRPWLPGAQWRQWEEAYRTTYSEYVVEQHEKESVVRAVQQALGRVADARKLDPAWRSAIKLHGATLALAEFAAVVGNLRASRFGRDSAWRNTALLGALDELRHTQIPLRLDHEWVSWDPQCDWTHRFFHTEDWVAIAARHFVDEMLLASDPIEFAIATNFVFETGFTNLQFVALSAVAHDVGDRLFETMIQSVQTDEARHAQIGFPVLEVLSRTEEGRRRLQFLVDKWFWRSWQFFAVVTGFAMDYLTPLSARKRCFAEFVREWVVGQFEQTLRRVGLERPWYWQTFLDSIETYHHMVYASAYAHRATVWFDLVLPSPPERAWLAHRYVRTWSMFDPVWERLTQRWRDSGPGIEWYAHGTTPVGFCDLCQLVLCGGSPQHNSARTVEIDGQKFVFCSEPCQWIFESEPERYRHHQGVVGRILAGRAPGNLLELLRYFGLSEDDWGKDVHAGAYPWLLRDDEGAGER